MSTAAQEPAGASAIPDLATLLDQLTGSPPAATANHDPPPAAAANDAQPGEAAATVEPLFADLDSFLRHYLAPVVERRLNQGAAVGVAWCPDWWRHPEAISRLYAIWRAWETLRVTDPDTGMSAWWRDHFDPHFAVLTGELGPFAKCSPDRGHVATTPLPVTAAPREVLEQLPDFAP